MRRDVHLVVSVTLDDAGVPTSARIEDDGPWAYSDIPQVYDNEPGEWRNADDEESRAAETYLGKLFDK